MGELGFCTIGDILKSISIALATDLTSDGGLLVFFSRILHNKLYYGVFYSLRCYFLYLDSFQLSLFVSPYLYPFILFALFGKMWRKRVWGMTLLMPLFFIFVPHMQLGEKIWWFKVFYVALAFVGGVKILFRIRKKKTAAASS
jgi:hypothetical protein